MKIPKCPCGSRKNFSECCDLCISGKQPAQTPEALMRSRYSAYTQGNIGYIEATMRGPASIGFNREEARAWSLQSEWLGLEVIKSFQESPTKGFVEFIAHFRINNSNQKIHEISEFHFIDNAWYYVDGNNRH